jgi:hypothetical protein
MDLDKLIYTKLNQLAFGEMEIKYFLYCILITNKD